MNEEASVKNDYRRIFGKNWKPLSVAFHRTGTSLSKHLKWVVRFAKEPVESDKAKLLPWCEDVYALTMLHADSPAKLAQLPLPPMDKSDDDSLNFSGFEAWSSLVRDCKSITRVALWTYIDDGVADLPEMTITPVVYRSGRQSRAVHLGALEWQYEPGQQEVRCAYMKGIRNLFIDCLCSILEAEAKLKEGKGKLMRCNSARCRQIFIQMKKGQRYCSTQCRTREAARAKRRRDRDQKRLDKGFGLKLRAVINEALDRQNSTRKPSERKTTGESLKMTRAHA